MSLLNDVSKDGANYPDYSAIRTKLANELSGRLNHLNDFYENLEASYENEVYGEFETEFGKIRLAFKDMLFSIDSDYSKYIARSESRQKQIEMIIQSADQIAKVFQDARETGRLDRTGCRGYLENLIIYIKNLHALVKPD